MMLRFLILAFSLILATTFPCGAQSTSETTVGGYGELHYNEPDGNSDGQLDFHRFVLYLGHKFSEEISFRSEIELEHTRIEAGEPEGGELAIEQAFLDYRLHEHFVLRAGILLPPVGIINSYHEPPTFNGVERPNVDRVIIPTTWREAGAGVYGTFSEGWGYQLYVVAGFDASGFSAGSGLRGGRQSAFKSTPTNPSLTGRIDYSPLGGFQIGASFFAGNSAAGRDSIGTARVILWSGDLRFNHEAFSLRAVGALASIRDASFINAKRGAKVADRIYGFYVEGAYNFLRHFCPESDHVLDAFLRYEKYDTQASTTGFARLIQYDRTDVVLGLTFKPTYDTAFKIDYSFFSNAMNSGFSRNTKQLNLGIGYYF